MTRTATGKRENGEPVPSSLLAKRESAPTTTAAHEASAHAKKALVKAHTLILRLEDGLKGLSDGKGGEKLGEGELRRRKDLLARERKEREVRAAAV